MISIKTDDEIIIITPQELVKKEAEAYKRGQIDMREIMEEEYEI